jgi:hypothetical protein
MKRKFPQLIYYFFTGSLSCGVFVETGFHVVGQFLPCRRSWEADFAVYPIGTFEQYRNMWNKSGGDSQAYVRYSLFNI